MCERQKGRKYDILIGIKINAVKALSLFAEYLRIEEFHCSYNIFVLFRKQAICGHHAKDSFTSLCAAICIYNELITMSLRVTKITDITGRLL